MYKQLNESYWIDLTYVDNTSDGRSVMYDGIFLPVRNSATSLLKTLQLCSNRLYLSLLCTRKTNTKEKVRGHRLELREARPGRVEKGG